MITFEFACTLKIFFDEKNFFAAFNSNSSFCLFSN